MTGRGAPDLATAGRRSRGAGFGGGLVVDLEERVQRHRSSRAETGCVRQHATAFYSAVVGVLVEPGVPAAAAGRPQNNARARGQYIQLAFTCKPVCDRALSKIISDITPSPVLWLLRCGGCVLPNPQNARTTAPHGCRRVGSVGRVRCRAPATVNEPHRPRAVFGMSCCRRTTR